MSLNFSQIPSLGLSGRLFVWRSRGWRFEPQWRHLLCPWASYVNPCLVPTSSATKEDPSRHNWKRLFGRKESNKNKTIPLLTTKLAALAHLKNIVSTSFLCIFPDPFNTFSSIWMYSWSTFQVQSYLIIIIRLLCRCAAVPAHEAYIAHTAHPVLCTHFGFKKGIRAVSCPYPTPICVK